MSATNAASAGKAQERQAQQQMEQQRLGAELQSETRERDSQFQLRNVLAAQSVMFGARGQDPNSPTSQRLNSAAIAGAADDSMAIRTQELMSKAGNGFDSVARRRATQGQMLGAGLQFGKDAWSVFSGRRSIGGA
ncbi:MAG: hypothetical protein H7Y60_17830 [Rhodospirillaceae bacterium]|nr:hypothetical protein [Rhodospirillales bacterium]